MGLMPGIDTQHMEEKDEARRVLREALLRRPFTEDLMGQARDEDAYVLLPSGSTLPDDWRATCARFTLAGLRDFREPGDVAVNVARALREAVPDDPVQRGHGPGTIPRGAFADMGDAPTAAERELVGRIAVDPRVFGGKPLIRGHRLAVEHVLGMLAAGDSPADLLKAYPNLAREDILACLAYARRVVSQEKGDAPTTKSTCHYCGNKFPAEDVRPYGPGGTFTCFPCANASPERKNIALKALDARLEEIERTGCAAIATPTGPAAGPKVPTP